MNLESCKYDFASDNINIFVMVYDISSSMEDYIKPMRTANKAFKDDFSQFEERGSIAIAKANFSDGFGMTPFLSVKDFDVSYAPYGNTAVYDAIVKSTESTIAYYNEIMKRLNVRPKITYLVFTDGGDNCSSYSSEDAKNSIKELNSLDATTVFVAFGEAIRYETGARLGFSCTKDINTVEELVTCMGMELSKSCKEQSKSAYSLKSSFFSQADKNAAEDDIEETTVLDEDFFGSLD